MKAVYEAGSDQPVFDVQTMQQLVAESLSSQRFPMILLGAFAALALLLASVGIYGVISYSVTQRVREIGIRLALGAEQRSIFHLVMGQGLRLALVGLAIGAVAALILTRVLPSFSHLLYGVGASDPRNLRRRVAHIDRGGSAGLLPPRAPCYSRRSHGGPPLEIETDF
jgi:ABC-type antimicrobial peptide transport system permease subunit